MRCGPKMKVQYRNQAEAEHRARVRMRCEASLVLRSYLCPQCKKWHLTKMAFWRGLQNASSPVK